MTRDFEFYTGGIEDGIIAVLRAALAQSVEGGYAKTIESYNGELDAQNLRAAIAELTPSFPLFLVAYGDGKDERDPPTALLRGAPFIVKHDCTFTVFCCSDDARGERTRRRGSAGVYRMIADAQTLLAGLQFRATVEGKSVLLTGQPLVPDGVEFLARLPDLTAYAVHFDTYFRYTTLDRRAPGTSVEELIIDVEHTAITRVESANLPGVTVR